jgi:RNA polymerase sigma-70 factor (ECF subfamily)
MDFKEEVHLTRKAIKGNSDAYGCLIAAYQSYLYKVAFLYMKNEEDALDVVGTTILKAYQHIHKLKNPEWFKTWITKILIRTALDELKKVVYFHDLENVQTASHPPEISLEEKCDLNSAIDQLSEKYRMVIVLKYFSDLSVHEISYIMNAPEGTVKAYLSRARDELKKTLKEDYFYAG